MAKKNNSAPNTKFFDPLKGYFLINVFEKSTTNLVNLWVYSLVVLSVVALLSITIFQRNLSIIESVFLPFTLILFLLVLFSVIHVTVRAIDDTKRSFFEIFSIFVALMSNFYLFINITLFFISISMFYPLIGTVFSILSLILIVYTLVSIGVNLKRIYQTKGYTVTLGIFNVIVVLLIFVNFIYFTLLLTQPALF